MPEQIDHRWKIAFQRIFVCVGDVGWLKPFVGTSAWKGVTHGMRNKFYLSNDLA
jgi:hypothetical protein